MSTIQLSEQDLTSLRRFGIGESVFGDQPLITLDPEEEASFRRLVEHGFVTVVNKDVAVWVEEVHEAMKEPGIDIKATKLVLDISLMMLGDRKQFGMFHISPKGTDYLIEVKQLLSDEVVEQAIDSLIEDL